MKFVKDVLGPLGTGPDAPFGEKRLEFGDLTWATAAVSSRAFTSLYGGWRQESKPLLVPFIDMLNFSFDQSNVKVLCTVVEDVHVVYRCLVGYYCMQ